MSPAHAVTHERFGEENEDRFELAGNAGYAAAVDQGHTVWILELWVHPDHRGQGRGTALLETVISHYGSRPLALSAEPITMINYEPAGPSADQLAAWYTRHGFQRDSGHRMTRRPGGPGHGRGRLGSTEADLGTIQEQAGAPLSRVGEQLAAAEAAMHDAVSVLRHAFGLVRGTRITPGQARSLVTVNARLGALGSAYLAEEASQFSAYDPGFQPADWSRAAVAAELKRLRSLSGLSCAKLGRALGVSRAAVSNIELGKTRVTEARILAWEQATRNAAREVPPSGISDAAGQALTVAGRQLAQAEVTFDEALNRFVDSVDLAVHAGLPAADVDSLIRAYAGVQNGALSIATWTADAAAKRTAIPVPAAFRDLDRRARIAKSTGGYEPAAAIWTDARSLLPDGHDLRGALDEMITSLRAAALTGQYVSPDGRLVPLPEAAVTVGKKPVSSHRRGLVPGEDSPGRMPEQDRPTAPQLTTGLEFTGQVGTRHRASQSGRPARTMSSPPMQGRPRGLR